MIRFITVEGEKIINEKANHNRFYELQLSAGRINISYNENWSFKFRNAEECQFLLFFFFIYLSEDRHLETSKAKTVVMHSFSEFFEEVKMHLKLHVDIFY